MVTIKGIRQGLLMVFSAENDPWLTRLRELESKLTANEAFFAGGQVAFDVGPLMLTSDDIQRSLALLDGYRIQLLAILTENDATRKNIAGMGIADALPKLESRKLEATEAVKTVSMDDVQDNATDGALIKKRVRAGQLVKHPGHVVVIGDVNPGAQILAGGDIIVWGRLQGSAHAGTFGDLSAVICALEMAPTLIKIADLAVRNHKGKGEMARVEGQEIVFSAWDKS